MIKGNIHSIETMGLVDGPGIRVVVFFQGCALRCTFCHNPDTWATSGGESITPVELVNKIERYKTYFKNSGGGVTFSGGEPLLQPDFLIEVLKLCRERGIHTTIDTAGVGAGRYQEILKYVDLILFDVKHYNPKEYSEITGREVKESLKFLEIAQEMNIKMWIRHVVMPGVTDTVEDMQNLADFIKELKNVEKIELLPYHLLGTNKYEILNIKYKLEGMPAMDKAKAKELEKLLIELVKK
ncbi:pyruvate formate-lyase-activating protein [Clostridium intestinale]|uniref:Pyruvate formate-lyase-activating enzyme n=2 Tax=Clostridium intestinale TaxID=36845 RepID=U2NMR4_9CLOT|nr:pyruvate formate-lyase-activating protein [Clostridium intestinale]ERK30453.1 pyruvate formate-lyase activating enzyme [Clostridium intestinale URNW]QLY81707.1 pyruvate formate lyase-activating protein [Clostridium intestinale]